MEMVPNSRIPMNVLDDTYKTMEQMVELVRNKEAQNQAVKDQLAAAQRVTAAFSAALHELQRSPRLAPSACV